MIETPKEILAHEASSDAASGFIQWRKMTKKPLTERAALLIAKTLREITGQGGDADEALDLAQEHGWQTIKVDWYWRIKNGKGNRQALQQRNGHPQVGQRSDPALEKALRLSGLGETQGNAGG